MSAEQLITKHLDIWTSAYKTRSAAGRGSSNKLDLYGIKKLRELILELAVRGKLVPQEPTDEPAIMLLSKIEIEKKRLEKEGVLKTSANEFIDKSEYYIDLPNGWEFARLGNLAKFIDYRGKTPTKVAEGIPLITAKNVRFGYIDREPREYITEIEYQDWMTRGYPKLNDLLFTTEAPLGNVAVIDIEEKFALAQRVICFQLHDPKLAKFLRIAIMSKGFQEQLDANATGMTATGVKSSKLKEIPVFIPPLAEQNRIVTKVDELMAFCDELEQAQTDNIAAHAQLVEALLTTLTNSKDHQELQANWQRIDEHFDTLFTTEDSIDQLKQTILQLAVMGKLVPQDPNDEPANELLKKIAAEKAQMLKEGKIKKEKPLQAISDEEKPFDLPVAWEWVKLGAVTTGMDSGWSPACLANNSPSDDVWGVLKTTSVQVMQYLEFENKELPKNLNPRPDAEVKTGDILFTRAGPMNRVGISCFVQRTRPKLMISDKIIRFHPVEIGISGRFITLCLNAGATAKFLESAKSGMASSQVNITQANLCVAPIPIPPLNEQNRIVAKIDEIVAVCESLKIKIQHSQVTKVALADSLSLETIG